MGFNIAKLFTALGLIKLFALVLSVVSLFLILMATDWSIGSYLPATERQAFSAALIGIAVATVTIILFAADYEVRLGRKFFLLDAALCLLASLLLMFSAGLIIGSRVFIVECRTYTWHETYCHWLRATGIVELVASLVFAINVVYHYF